MTDAMLFLRGQNARVRIVVLCILAAFAANGQESPHARRPAWEWSLEERISVRVEPVSIRERAEAAERERAEDKSIRPVYVGPVQFIVEGKRNPELLMPFELFGSLMGGIDPDPRSKLQAREQYQGFIAAFGWDEDVFWAALESAASDLMKAEAERGEQEATSEKLQIRQCGLRAEALEKVRAHFGHEIFDRFLYAVVAPQISIASRFPADDEAWRLRYVEGGCR